MPKVKKELKRTLMIHTRVSPEEKKIIIQKQKANKFRTQADYVRDRIL